MGNDSSARPQTEKRSEAKATQEGSPGKQPKRAIWQSNLGEQYGEQPRRAIQESIPESNPGEQSKRVIQESNPGEQSRDQSISRRPIRREPRRAIRESIPESTLGEQSKRAIQESNPGEQSGEISRKAIQDSDARFGIPGSESQIRVLRFGILDFGSSRAPKTLWTPSF